MQFDHLMHWVPSLDDAVKQAAERGFPARIGGRLGRGMHNALWRARDLTAIELISVHDQDAWRSRRRGSGAAAREAALVSGGALQFAFEVDDLASAVADVRSRGIEISDPQVGTLDLGSGGTVSWQAALITEGPGWRPFFIQYATPRTERLRVAHERSSPLMDWRFRRLDLETPNPAQSANWLARVLGVQREWSDGMTEVPAFGCRVRFVPGHLDRVTRILLDGTEGPMGDFIGVRYERRA
jgi:catechol 2,3-dioxygenase-like lactoylglutathione lyase family enzyme